MESLRLVDTTCQKLCDVSINNFLKTEQDRHCTFKNNVGALARNHFAVKNYIFSVCVCTCAIFYCHQ